MTTFAIGEFVLLVSKVDNSDIHIGSILELSPSIRIKFPTLFMFSFENEGKFPFTMYKLANSKIYNRISKAIVHGIKRNLPILEDSTFLLLQPVTYPLISLICELVSEWIFNNETILIVSENADDISKLLGEKGFRVSKVTAKFDERSMNKFQIICSTSNGLCCDQLKNYLFTRVIIEGAHRVS